MAGKANLQTDLRHRKIGQDEQMLGALDLRQRPVLMRRLAKHGAEEPDEMMRSKTSPPRDLVHRRPCIILRPQEVAGEAQTAQDFRMQHGCGNTLKIAERRSAASAGNDLDTDLGEELFADQQRKSHPPTASLKAMSAAASC